MKLSVTTPNVQKSGEFKEAKFGIGDMALIFEILRGKMYPNPIKTLTQELMCNARDAHREVKKARTPIEVHLPSTLEPHWSVRDFGPGITPSRMADVFINYGASTKRDSNKQTGGFGLGAKSPFSYTDSFCIESITPEVSFQDDNGQTHENCLVLRKYVAYIDPSRVGTMSLVSEEVTTQEQGTKIIVAVKREDFNNFFSWTAAAAEFWAVRPKFNVERKWVERTFIFTQDNWKIEKVTYGGGYIHVILDGIKYDVSYENLGLKEYPFTHYTNLYLYFETGKLAVTANREHLDYNPETKKAILDAVSNSAEYVTTTIQTELNKCSNLWDAYLQLAKSVNTIGIKKTFSKGALKWKDIELKENCEIPIWDIPGITARFYKKNLDGKVGVDRTYSTPSAITVKAGNFLVWNDEDNVSPSSDKLRTVFGKTSAHNLLVITSATDEAVKKINLEHLNPIKLSEVTKTKMEKRYQGGSSSKCYIKKFRDTGSWTDSWKPETLKLEDGKGLVYVRCENGNYPVVNGKTFYRSGEFYTVCNLIGTEVYRISNMISDKKIKEAGWISLEEAVNNRIDELVKTLPAKAPILKETDNIFEIFNASYHTAMSFVKAKFSVAFFSGISKESVAYRYLNLCLESAPSINYTRIVEKINTLATSCNNTRKIDINFADNGNLRREFVKKYPLMVDAIRFCTHAGGNDHPYFDTNNLVEYVNFIDKKA